MKLSEALFYAAATFLLGVIAVATMEVGLEVVSYSREGFFKTLQDFAVILTIGGPIVFVVAGFARAIDWSASSTSDAGKPLLSGDR